MHILQNVMLNHATQGGTLALSHPRVYYCHVAMRKQTKFRQIRNESPHFLERRGPFVKES